MPVPEKILNAPELHPGLDLYLVSYLDLTTCRSIGFGEGPIPWTAIQTYCEVQGFEGELREDVFYHVQHLDAEYLKWRSKQVDKK